MRRPLTICITLILTLFCGLSPSLAAIPAGALSSAQSGWSGKVDEAKLPACCRRNGKHHCAMQSGERSTRAKTLAEQLENSAHNSFVQLVAPNCCPCPPQSLVSVSPQSPVLATPSVALLEPTLAAGRSSANQRPLAPSKQRTWPKRGPPSPQIL